MFVGYARVSTNDQTLDLQKDALNKAGCERVFTDTASGAKSDRPGLAETLQFMRVGDTLVVWRLDRLGRSLQHLIETVTVLGQRRVGFKSLTENIDTSTGGGKLVFHMFGALELISKPRGCAPKRLFLRHKVRFGDRFRDRFLAEFERDLIRERTQAGLLAARARGHIGGRPKSTALNDPKKVTIAQALYDDTRNTIEDICHTLHVSRSTLYRYLTMKSRLSTK